jgi:hypothetical protein
MLAPVDRYSCDIYGYLEVEGRQFSIARLNGDIVGLRELADMPPGPATIVMFYDGEMKRTPVLLPAGISSTRPKTSYARV